MTGQDFIITSLQSWDIEIGSTIKNTANEIAKHNRVLYINTPMDTSTRYFGNKELESYKKRLRVIQGKEPYLRKIKENLWVADCPFTAYSINKLPTTSLFDFFNKLNNKKIAKFILETAQELNFKNFIHLIDTDIYRSQYLKEMLKPAISIYYCRDYVIGESYWKKNGARLEPKIAAKADIVLVNSTKFAERFHAYNKNVNPIETGVNLELYDASKEWVIPNDLKEIPRPIIGYIGTLNSTRLDIPLLEELAKECPDYSFVFTGPEDQTFKESSLHQLPNCFFLGKKTVPQLPSYIKGYDVCINPQKVNPITDGNYPLKIDEYLAMGKPTVATSTHTMRDIFIHHSLLATGISEYKDALKKALQESEDIAKEKERIRFAHTHSWGHSVAKIYKIIEKFKYKNDEL